MTAYKYRPEGQNKCIWLSETEEPVDALSKGQTYSQSLSWLPGQYNLSFWEEDMHLAV